MRLLRGINELDRLMGKKSEDLNPGERWVRYFSGAKLYPLNIKKAKQYIRYEASNEINQLYTGLKRARKNGRVKEVIRIRETINKTRREMREKLR